MNGPAQKSLGSISKALLISLFLHSLIFSSIIIVFPKQFNSLKPKIHFLGSILNKQDVLFSDTSNEIKKTRNHLPFSANELSPNQSLSLVQLKPTMVQGVTTEEKQQLKSLFAAPLIKKESKHREFINTYRKITASSYQPLKIE